MTPKTGNTVTSMLKNKFQNFIEVTAPTAIGVGIVFTVVSSRMSGNTVAHWLGLGLSLALLVLGVIFAPRKKSLEPWARALTIFGITYVLYNVTINDWEKMFEGAIAVLVGLILTPSK
jgi:hypothetical protein